MERFRGVTIFLAEDSEDDIEITRRALRRSNLGCNLKIARDGEEALRLLSVRDIPPPDLAILDLHLPKIDGFEVLKAIKQDGNRAAFPVIMLSSSSREEDVKLSYELGANSYVVKPVVFEEFVSALEALARYWLEIVRLPRYDIGVNHAGR
jgi:two-component system response regulator